MVLQEQTELQVLAESMVLQVLVEQTVLQERMVHQEHLVLMDKTVFRVDKIYFSTNQLQKHLHHTDDLIN